MKTLEEIKEYIEEQGYDSVVVFDNPAYCTAFIGISSDGRAVYDYEKMVQSLMEEDGMEDETDAIEFIDYNTIRSLPFLYGEAPIVVYPVRED